MLYQLKRFNRAERYKFDRFFVLPFLRNNFTAIFTPAIRVILVDVSRPSIKNIPTIYVSLKIRYIFSYIVLFIIRITSDDLLFQEMKVNWATSPGNQPKQDTSSKYGVTLRCYVGGNMFYQVV